MVKGVRFISDNYVENYPISTFINEKKKRVKPVVKMGRGNRDSQIVIPGSPCGDC